VRLPRGRKWDPRVEADLRDVIEARIGVDALLAQRAGKKGGMPPRVTPAVMTELEVDNEVSADYTVIDVYTQDRLRGLYSRTQNVDAGGTRRLLLEGRYRGRSGRRRVLRARQGNRLEDHRRASTRGGKVCAGGSARCPVVTARQNGVVRYLLVVDDEEVIRRTL